MKINNGWKVIVIILLLFSTANFAFTQGGRGKGRLKGKVLDENGNPIENAKIVFTSIRFQDLSFETTSDKKGKWAYIGLGSGMWRVSVTAEGYSPAYKETNVKQLKKQDRRCHSLLRALQIDKSRVGKTLSETGIRLS